MGYLNLAGSFVYKEPLFRAKLDALAENDSQLKTDGWAQSTKTVFYQASVPAGWTQDASQNDKALRVVGSIGGGGSGGTQALSSTIPLAHTHTISSDDAHTHAYAAHTHSLFTDQFSQFDNGQGTPGMLYSGTTGNITRYSTGGGSVNSLDPSLSTPGALTLGSEAAHDHGGTTSSQLTDVALAYCDVIIGTKDAPGGTYTDLTSYWHTGDKADFDPFAEYAANDAYNYGNLIPAATVSIFAQASAPPGWTKVASVNDRMLRIVSGSGGGVGGTVLISIGLVLAHTHPLPATGDHAHSIPAHSHTMAVGSSVAGTAVPITAASYVQDIGGQLVRSSDSGPTDTRTIYKKQTVASGVGSTTPAGAHTHTLPTSLADILLAYVDVIQCSKDSTGAPYAYTDLTSEFAWQKLASKQRLNNLGKNDAYIQYHTTPTLTQMLFFMASPPTGWVKVTSQHDMALRMVSGGSGGMPGGGAHLLSQVISLAHTHVIVAGGGHTHSATHTHVLDSASVTANPPMPINVRGRSVGASKIVASDIPYTGLPSQPSYSALSNQSGNPVNASGTPIVPVADPDHAHGGVTDSALTDVSLAYADVIWCTKA